MLSPMESAQRGHPRARSAWRWLCVAAVLGIAAVQVASCGGESTGSPTSHVIAGTVSATVGPSGGTLTHPSGASVTIPPGALTTTITVTIQGIDPPSASAVDGTPISQGFILGPEGQTFARPVTVTLPFDPSVVSGVDSRELVIESAVTGTASFLEQTSVVDVTANTLVARTLHFSTYSAARVVDAPLIATASPIQGTVDVPSSVHLQVNQTPPQGPYTWGLALGSPLLPSGFVLAPDGTLQGSAPAPVDALFTVEVRDSANPQHVMQEPLELVVLEAPPEDGGVPYVDAGEDAGEDAGIDAGEPDAGFDSGEDAGFDGGADAGIDGGGFDAGADAGYEAGPDGGQPDASDASVCGALTQCGASCVDTTSDPQNCGGCGSVCPGPPTGASETCINGLCGYACSGDTCPATCVAGYADTDGNPADGCETSIQCVYTTNTGSIGPCVTNTIFENVDQFWLVQSAFSSDPQGGMSTSSPGIARLFNEDGSVNYPYFNATDSTDTLYVGPPIAPENGGRAQRSGNTISFTFDWARGSVGCEQATEWHTVCSGSATLQ
jgi:ZU5 domain